MCQCRGVRDTPVAALHNLTLKTVSKVTNVRAASSCERNAPFIKSAIRVLSMGAARQRDMADTRRECS